VNGVFDAGRLALDVIVLHRRVLAAVAQLLDGVVLWEEAEAEWISLPANEGVGVAALLAILALHSELLRVQGRRHRLHVNVLGLSNDFARRQVDVLILVGPGATSNTLAELAAGHLVLIAAAQAVPAVRIAIIWARGLLQGIWHRGAWDAVVVVCLRGVAPVAGVRLVDEEANMSLICTLSVAAGLHLALGQQWNRDVLRGAQVLSLLVSQVVRPPHHSLAAVSLLHRVQEVWVVAHDRVELRPDAAVLVRALEAHATPVGCGTVDLLQLWAAVVRYHGHELL